MTNHNNQPNRPEEATDAALRERIFHRAKTLATEIVNRLNLAVADLSEGNHLGALGALAGIERDLTTIRAILLLLS